MMQEKWERWECAVHLIQAVVFVFLRPLLLLVKYSHKRVNSRHVATNQRRFITFTRDKANAEKHHHKSWYWGGKVLLHPLLDAISCVTYLVIQSWSMYPFCLHVACFAETRWKERRKQCKEQCVCETMRPSIERRQRETHCISTKCIKRQCMEERKIRAQQNSMTIMYLSRRTQGEKYPVSLDWSRKQLLSCGE